MATKILSCTNRELNGIIISVEVDITRGMPAFSIVGLPDAAIKESKERVRSALINSGLEFPLGRITVNLAPADIKKIGSLLDLPIALGILIESMQLNVDSIEDFLIIGELSLDGSIKGICGCFPAVLKGIDSGIKKFIIPSENINELVLLKECEVYPFENLNQVLSYLTYKDMKPFDLSTLNISIESSNTGDYSEIIGNESAKRALEIAAAGFHNVLLFGPPGTGKSMLAKRLPSIMPRLSHEEQVEIMRIYSASGLIEKNKSVVLNRPFRSPHHTTTNITMSGGGRDLRAGEVTLAHRGVLFLDELPEFKRTIIEVLREPLEEGIINVSRLGGSVVYPANFLFVGAMNPCPCGKSGENLHGCSCSELEIKRYISRLSRAFLDRIDIFVHVPYTPIKDYGSNSSEKSSSIKERVENARNRQNFRNGKDVFNSELTYDDIRKKFKFTTDVVDAIDIIYKRYSLSIRALNKIIQVARTIADLNDNDDISKGNIYEALNYRKFINGEVI